MNKITTKIFVFSTLFILLISSNLLAQQNWYWQYPLPQGNPLYGVEFISSSIGWSVGSYGTILKTTDGGTTWTLQSSGTRKSFRDVSFIDENNGTAVGRSGIVLRTTNGGTTWTQQTSGTTNILMGVSFTDVNNGTVVGYDGIILRTTNGGTTWTQQSSGTTNHLNDVSFTNLNIGTAVGSGGIILRTINGGTTWTLQSSGTQRTLNAVSFTDSSNGTIVGNSGTILKTTNGGTTWTQQSSGSSNFLYDVSFADANNGITVGSGGRILRTTDGGLTWIEQLSGTYNMFLAVFLTNANIGITVGYDGIILGTMNGGTTWTLQSSEPVPVLYDVHFSDINYGTTVGGYGTILRTTNGGVTWTLQSSGTTHNFSGVSFTDANNGTAVGGGGTILRTTNGGISWTQQSSGTTEYLGDVSFTDANIGTAVGSGGTILRTTNGGTTWTQQSSGTTEYLRDVSFTDANIGTAVGGGGTILRTTNGGISWTIQSSGTTNSLIGVSFSDANNGTAVGVVGTILRTTNGGTTWTQQTSGTTDFLTGVSFTDANNGTVVSDYGKILNTINGGTTWTSQESGTYNTLEAVYFIDANNGTTVGGYSNGNILRAEYNPQLELVSPSNDETITSEEINCQWSDVSAQYYRLIVDNNSGLGSSEIFDSITTTSQTIAGYFLEANTYYWKVIAYFSDGSSVQSDVGYFHYDPPKLSEPSWIPLYRFFKSADHDHFYCTTDAQRDTAIAYGYTEEGTEGFISAKPFDHPDMKNIFRLYSGDKKAHFYTTDGNEKDFKIIDGYTYEGIVGFSYGVSSPEVVPMYQLHLDTGSPPNENTDYFYTISWAERRYAEDLFGFTYDGIMTYVSPNNGKISQPLSIGQILAALGVNTQNGNFQSPRVTSFNIADRGIPLRFEHFYNSFGAVLFNERNPLSPGWTHTYNAYVSSVDPTAVNTLFNVVWPDGNIHKYYKEGTSYNCKTPGIYDSIDVVNFPTHFKIIKKDQTIYEFQTPGGAPVGSPAVLSSIIDKNGNTITCQYNVVNQDAINLLTVTGTTGRQLLFTYYTTAGKEHLIKSVQDPDGRTIQFIYDINGNLSRFINAEGRDFNYEYNSQWEQDKLMTKFIFPKGNFIENVYDTVSINGSNVKYVKEQVDGSTNSTFHIDIDNSIPSSPVSTVNDPNGQTWQYTSSADNLVIQIYNASLVFAIDIERLDSNNPTLPTRITDGRNFSTTYSYDSKGNVETINQPEGANHQFWYDSKNNLTKYRNPRTFDFDYIYDGNGNLTDIIKPSGTTSLSYLPGGLVQSIQNPLFQTTSFTYDSYGSIQSVTDPLYHITNYTYDGTSRLINVTNPKMQTTSYTYDNLDRVRYVNDPSGQTNYTYDENSNLRTVTNPKGQITTLSYHPVTDWLMSTQNSIGNQTDFNYHPNGLLSSKTDAMGVTTNYAYDNAGRLTNISSPTRNASMTYDENSNLLSVTDMGGGYEFYL